MSVVLLIKDFEDAPDRSIAVATQAHFVGQWVRGASALGLEWVPLAETGFDITADNRSDVLDELKRLRAWFAEHDDAHSIARLDPLVGEIERLQFERGATAFFG
ncbi:MAG: hypothetical protein AB7T06_41145 [Kofleriaceae bacterium]